ncbi:unnamed protein product [Fusarium graminearum]|uniref:Chromosome 2, complete genome n=1 Tax=Gibberella zeae (strain ATCC MYA-4620 / CBS 123657 / FGSC 9075 / NRRL 31084 / PH-1) TaxID=229533 RepID=A0A098DBY5_GIBZE|nr:unnamed protein product [Fusarium graminearum]
MAFGLDQDREEYDKDETEFQQRGVLVFEVLSDPCIAANMFHRIVIGHQTSYQGRRIE